MRLYFVRHGESEANILQEFSNRDFDKHPLTLKGREQAQALAEKLRGTDFAEIYASPLRRARETADILKSEKDTVVQITPALCEHDAGELEGRHDQESWRAFQDLFETWILKRDFDARIPPGESFNDLRARFVPFLEGVVQKHTGSDANILLVGHGGLFHAILPVVLTNVGHAFAYQHILGNTGLVVAEPRDRILYCLEWAGIVLTEGEQNEV